MSVNYADFLYLNPETAFTGQLLGVDSVKAYLDAYVASGGSLSDYKHDRSAVPQEFNGSVYLADISIIGNVSRLNATIRKLLTLDGWTPQQINDTGEFVRNIDRAAVYDGTSKFTVADPITDLVVSVGDSLQIAVDDYDLYTGTVASVNYNNRIVTVEFPIGRNPPVSATEYRLTGIKVVDPDRVGAINYVRGAHISTPAISVPDTFNFDLYKLLYPETRLMTIEEAYVNYVSQNGQFQFQAGSIDDIRLVSGELRVEGESLFLGDVVISTNLEVNAPSTFGGPITVNADIDVASNISCTSLNASETVYGTVTTTSNLTAYVSTNLGGDTQVAGVLGVSGTSAFVGATSFDGSTVFNGFTSFSNATHFSGSTLLRDNTEIQDFLVVSGPASFSNSVGISGPLTVTGNSLFSGEVVTFQNSAVHLGETVFSGPVTFSNDVTCVGSTFTDGPLFVSGYAGFSNTVDFYSNVTFHSDASFSKDIYAKTVHVDALVVNESLITNGTASFCNSMVAKAPAQFDDSATFNGLALFNSQATFVDPATFSGPVAFQNQVAHSNFVEFFGSASFRNSVSFISSVNFADEAVFDGSVTTNAGVTHSNSVDVLGTLTACNLVVNDSLSAPSIHTNDISSATLVSETVRVSAAFVSNLEVAEDLVVGGDGTFSNAVDVYGPFTQHASAVFELACSVQGQLTASNDMVVKGLLTCDSNVIVRENGVFEKNLTVHETTRLSGVTVTGVLSASNNSYFAGPVTLLSDLDVTQDASFSGSNDFSGSVVVSGDLLSIPVGPTSNRPVPPRVGAIRFNTDIHTFEGYSDGSNWSSLGGVIDSDRDTFVSAKDNNSVIITTLGVDHVIVTDSGDVGIGTLSPSCKLDVNGVGCFSNLSLTGIPNLSNLLAYLDDTVRDTNKDPPFVIDTLTESTSNAAELSGSILIDESESQSETFTVYAFAARANTPGFSNNVQFSRFLRKVTRYGDASAFSVNTVPESGSGTSLSNIALTKSYNTEDFAEAPSNLEIQTQYRVQFMVEDSRGYKTVLKQHQDPIFDIVETSDIFAPTFSASYVVALSDSNIRIDVTGIDDIGVMQTVAYAVATDPVYAFTAAEIDGMALSNEGQCNADVSFIIDEYYTRSNGDIVAKNMQNYSLYNTYTVIYDIANPPNKTIQQLESVLTFDRDPPTHGSTEGPVPVPGGLTMTLSNILDDTTVLLYPSALPGVGTYGDAETAYSSVLAEGIPGIEASVDTQFSISNFIGGLGIEPMAEFTDYRPFAVLADTSNNLTLVTFNPAKTLDESPPVIVSGYLDSIQTTQCNILVEGAAIRDDFHTFSAYLFVFDSTPVPDSTTIKSRLADATYDASMYESSNYAASVPNDVSITSAKVITTGAAPSLVGLTHGLDVYPVLYVVDDETRVPGGNDASYSASSITLDFAPPVSSLSIATSNDLDGQPIIVVSYDTGDAEIAKLFVNSDPGEPPVSALSLLTEVGLPFGTVANILGSGSFTSNAVENTAYYAWIAVQDSFSNRTLESPCNVFVPGIDPDIDFITTSLQPDNTVVVGITASDKGRSGLAKAYLEVSSNNAPSNVQGAGVELTLSGDSNTVFYTTPRLEGLTAYYFHALALDTASNVSTIHTQALTDNGGLTYTIGGPTFDILQTSSNVYNNMVCFQYVVSHVVAIDSIKAFLGTSNATSNMVDEYGIELMPTTSNALCLSNLSVSGSSLDPSTFYTISVMATDELSNVTLEYINTYTLDDILPTVDSVIVSHVPPSNVSVDFTAADAYDGSLTGVYVLVTDTAVSGDITSHPDAVLVTSDSGTVDASVASHCNTFVYVVAEDSATTFGSQCNLFSDSVSNITTIPSVTVQPTFQQIGYEIQPLFAYPEIFVGSSSGNVAVETDVFRSFLVLFHQNDLPADIVALSNLLDGNPNVRSGTVVGEPVSLDYFRTTSNFQSDAVVAEYSISGTVAVTALKTFVGSNAATLSDVETYGLSHNTLLYTGTFTLATESLGGSPVDPSTNYTVTLLVQDDVGTVIVDSFDTYTLDDVKPTIDVLDVAHTGTDTVSIAISASDAFQGSVSKIYAFVGTSNVVSDDISGIGDVYAGSNAQFDATVPSHCNTYVLAQAEDVATSFGAPAPLLSPVESNVTLIPEFTSSEDFTQETDAYEILRSGGTLNVDADAGPVRIYYGIFRDGTEPLTAPDLSNVFALSNENIQSGVLYT